MEALFLTKIIGVFIILITTCVCDNEVCDRRPLGTTMEALRPDNQFVLEVDKIKNNKYIPNEKYKVILRSTYGNASFIAFTISLKEDTLLNKVNPRKPTHLKAGTLKLYENSMTAKISPACENTIIQSDVTPKTRVEVEWHAPDKDNNCVTIFSVVAISRDVWYSYESPLSVKLCEDPRRSEDMPPSEIDGDCNSCEDARYRLTFQGLWTYNTHHATFPSARELARFSDVVGASHSPVSWLFRFDSEASIGIKMLAEQGNTTQFEVEIQRKLPTTVRTVIKAIGPEMTNESTTTSFRASPQHHRLSMAVGILPSPDWFLGVSQLELCDVPGWRQSIKLNLYPIDAGTDKGLDFESSNEEQSPFQPIRMLAGIGKLQEKPKKPFARLIVELVRTYSTPQCIVTTPDTQTEENQTEDDNSGGSDETAPEEAEEKPSYATQRPQRARTTVITTTTTSEEPPEEDSESDKSCPMSSWGDWQPCQGQCVGGVVAGVRQRLRHHLLDGLVVKQLDRGSAVPQDCMEKYSEFDFEPCKETCSENQDEEEDEAVEENESKASGRIWRYFRDRK